MTSVQPDNLRLTDFLDLPTLQEIQDSFAAVADVKAVITDAEGNLLTQPTASGEFVRRQRALAEAAAAAGAITLAAGARRQSDRPRPATGGDWGAEEFDIAAHWAGGAEAASEYVAPIMVNDQRLGSIRMSANDATMGVDESRLADLAQRVGIPPRDVRALVTGWVNEKEGTAKPAAIQFLYLLANAIARLCYQEYQLRQRIHELTALNNVAMMLSDVRDARDLNKVLRRIAQVVCDVMGTKASSIRLVDAERDELVIKAVHNLSPEYLNKGRILLSKAEIDHEALGSHGFEYVRDMTGDPRVQYPEEARREGIVSMLSVGMRFKGEPIGVLRVYTDEEQAFSPLKIDLLKAVGAQAAAAIVNARLLEESLAAEALEKQVEMAADVQQRMVPQTPPAVPGLDVASVYVPCFALGGDFYDFIPLPDDNLGLAVADVSGKGVPASLTMASVRAFLRAQVDNVYYLYEVVRRINLMLCRDTKPGEFVTLFYGVLDAKNRRFTYCNAGHPPGLVLREGKVTELASDNMVLGVSSQEPYEQKVVDLKPGDTLLLYTDGLADGMNSRGETFGRQRVVEAFKRAGAVAASAEEVAQNVVEELREFVGSAKRTDDVTMLVVRVAERAAT